MVITDDLEAVFETLEGYAVLSSCAEQGNVFGVALRRSEASEGMKGNLAPNTIVLKGWVPPTIRSGPRGRTEAALRKCTSAYDEGTTLEDALAAWDPERRALVLMGSTLMLREPEQTHVLGWQIAIEYTNTLQRCSYPTLEDKIELAKFAEENDLGTSDYTVIDIDKLTAQDFRKVLDSSGTSGVVMVAEGLGTNGKQLRLVRTPEVGMTVATALSEVAQKLSLERGSGPQPGAVKVRLMPLVAGPSVEVDIAMTETGVYMFEPFQGVFLLKSNADGSFEFDDQGCQSLWRASDAQLAKIEACALRYARAMHKRGYRGMANINAALHPDGTMRVTEVNARPQIWIGGFSNQLRIVDLLIRNGRDLSAHTDVFRSEAEVFAFLRRYTCENHFVSLFLKPISTSYYVRELAHRQIPVKAEIEWYPEGESVPHNQKVKSITMHEVCDERDADVLIDKTSWEEQFLAIFMKRFAYDVLPKHEFIDKAVLALLHFLQEKYEKEDFTFAALY